MPPTPASPTPHGEDRGGWDEGGRGRAKRTSHAPQGTHPPDPGINFSVSMAQKHDGRGARCLRWFTRTAFCPQGRLAHVLTASVLLALIDLVQCSVDPRLPAEYEGDESRRGSVPAWVLGLVLASVFLMTFCIFLIAQCHLRLPARQSGVPPDGVPRVFIHQFLPGEVPPRPQRAHDKDCLQPRPKLSPFLRPGSDETISPPEAYICCIPRELMSDPVTTADGHTYERQAIGHWLHRHSSSPITGEVLVHKQLPPNHALRSLIHEWYTAQRAHLEQQQQLESGATAHDPRRACEAHRDALPPGVAGPASGIVPHPLWVSIPLNTEPNHPSRPDYTPSVSDASPQPPPTHPSSPSSLPCNTSPHTTNNTAHLATYSCGSGISGGSEGLNASPQALPTSLSSPTHPLGRSSQ